MKTPFKGHIFCLTNVCFSSLCEAGTITGNTSKLFCAPQLGSRFREAQYCILLPVLHEMQRPLSSPIKKLHILPHHWLRSVAKWGRKNTTSTIPASCFHCFSQCSWFCWRSATLQCILLISSSPPPLFEPLLMIKTYFASTIQPSFSQLCCMVCENNCLSHFSNVSNQ